MSEQQPPFDYDADARDRIWRLLEIRNVSFRDRLKQSVDTAGAQLEYFKPSVMGGMPLYAGPAVMAVPGTVLIVLAHHKKAFTVTLRAAPEHTLAEAITNSVDYAKEGLGSYADQISAGGLIFAIEGLIKKHGRIPGQQARELEHELNIHIIGTLFLPLPDAAKADVVELFERLITKGVCPALVGLLGKGSKEGLSLAWPLPLALAPYADRVIPIEKDEQAKQQ
jgi:hypothetical protein